MSGRERPSFAVQARVSESATATRNPSWISRKGVSSRPPPPPAPSVEPQKEPEPEVVAAPPPEPPPPAIDLGLSSELARLTEENAALHAKVAEMAAAMAGLRRNVLESSEPELVRLAVTIAERVVGRELSLDPTLIVSWARDAIHALASQDEVIIALAKDVSAQVPAEAWDVIEVEHRVQADPLLAPGAVEVRTAEGVVATGAESRMGAVSQALGVGES